MSQIKIIASASHIKLQTGWSERPLFKSQARLVDGNGKPFNGSYLGRQYQIIKKLEKPFSPLERLGRGLLALVWVICSLGLALLFKPARNLFTKKKESVHYAIAYSSQKTPNKELPQKLFPKRDSSFTHIKLSDYLSGLLQLKLKSPKEGVDKMLARFIVDRRYYGRQDVAYFGKDGSVFNSNGTKPIAFAYSPCLQLHGEDFDPIHIRKILEKLVQENAKKPIPKLFIPIAAFPKQGLGHALLFVVEPDVADRTKARITLIDSFSSGGYRAFKTKLIATAKQVFASPQTTLAENDVRQQQDAWSCGWHTIENIEFLSNIKNVQQFVNARQLPVRNESTLNRTFAKMQTDLIDGAHKDFIKHVKGEHLNAVIKKAAQLSPNF